MVALPSAVTQNLEDHSHTYSRQQNFQIKLKIFGTGGNMLLQLAIGMQITVRDFEIFGPVLRVPDLLFLLVCK